MGAQISSLSEDVNQFCFISGFNLTSWSKLPLEENICSDSSDVFPSFKLLDESFHLSGDFSVCPSFLRKSCLVLGVTVAYVRDHGNTYSNLKSKGKRKGKVCNVSL